MKFASTLRARKHIRAAREVENDHQICHESPLCGPRTRRSGSQVHTQAGVGQTVSTRAHGYSRVGWAHSNPLASLRELTNVPEPLLP
jgi:hypothetical protein